MSGDVEDKYRQAKRLISSGRQNSVLPPGYLSLSLIHSCESQDALMIGNRLRAVHAGSEAGTREIHLKSKASLTGEGYALDPSEPAADWKRHMQAYQTDVWICPVSYTHLMAAVTGKIRQHHHRQGRRDRCAEQYHHPEKKHEGIGASVRSAGGGGLLNRCIQRRRAREGGQLHIHGL